MTIKIQQEIKNEIARQAPCPVRYLQVEVVGIMGRVQVPSAAGGGFKARSSSFLDTLSDHRAVDGYLVLT